MPRVFDKGDGYIAEGWRQLGSNPGASDLLVSVVASPENTGVEGKGHDGGDVGSVNGALCGMSCMVSANVRVVKGIAWWLWCPL